MTVTLCRSSRRPRSAKVGQCRPPLWGDLFRVLGKGHWLCIWCQWGGIGGSGNSRIRAFSCINFRDFGKTEPFLGIQDWASPPIPSLVFCGDNLGSTVSHCPTDVRYPPAPWFVVYLGSLPQDAILWMCDLHEVWIAHLPPISSGVSLCQLVFGDLCYRSLKPRISPSTREFVLDSNEKSFLIGYK